MAVKAVSKDPTIAALISVAGMFILGAPAVGYFYLNNMRKGLVYLAASWVLLFVIVIALVGSVFTGGLGFICALPLALAGLCLNLLIVYDVYLTAQGQKPKLPSF